MTPSTRLIAAALGCFLASAGHADIVTHTGSTAGGPTYTRPLEDLSGLSAVGVGVRYDAYTFSVSTSGDYTFLTTGAFDTFSTLYSPSFGAATPLVGARIASDDLLSAPFTTSGFSFSLVAGINYSLVTTGFAPTDSGRFSTTIAGSGTVTPAAAEGPSQSGPTIITHGGTTAGAPTFTRPLEDLSSLSAVGVGVHYDSFHFRVGASGDYTFLTSGLFDTFDVLYAGAFDPTHPLTHALAGNDDLLASPFTTSGFAATLATGIDYYLVTTGFSPTDFGAFSTTIGGPGSVISDVVMAPVPETETWAMLALGLGLVGAVGRRRSRDRSAGRARATSAR